MIPGIRLATEAETKEIASTSDLGPATTVWVWPKDAGESDKGVIRIAPELDPVHFAPSSGHQRKALFFWGVLNILRANGVPAVYFNIDAEGTEDYQSILEKMGAEKTTSKPQFRYKMSLL